MAARGISSSIRSATPPKHVAVRRLGASDFAIQQLVNNAVASTEVVDILEVWGFDRPDISVISEEFMIELQNMKHKNLAVQALKNC